MTGLARGGGARFMGSGWALMGRRIYVFFFTPSFDFLFAHRFRVYSLATWPMKYFLTSMPNSVHATQNTNDFIYFINNIIGIFLYRTKNIEIHVLMLVWTIIQSFRQGFIIPNIRKCSEVKNLGMVVYVKEKFN